MKWLCQKEYRFKNVHPTKDLSKKIPYLRRCRRDAEMPLSPFFFCFCNCAVVPNDGIEQAARVCTKGKEKHQFALATEGLFQKWKFSNVLLVGRWRLWMGSILSFHLIAPIAPWIRIETQPTITCLLGGDAIVCCGSTSEGILKLKQHSESTSHFWLPGSIILPPESQKSS